MNPAVVRPLLAEEDATASSLIIDLEESNNAVNNIKMSTAREVVVRVDDENHKPVAGALVTFALPNDGAGANFINGGKLFQAVTDSKGHAIARMYPNQVTGKFQIHVNAALNGHTGTAIIGQTNVLPAVAPHVFLGMSAKTLAIVSSIAAAGAVGAGIAATRGGGGSTVSAGTGTVTAPR